MNIARSIAVILDGSGGGGVPNSDLLRQALLLNTAPTVGGLIVGEEPGRGTQRAMQPGRCVNFDGTDDYIDCGSGLITDGDFTISLWLKIPSVGVRGVFGMGDAFLIGGKGFTCYVHSDMVMYFNVADGTNAVGSGTSGTFSTGVWHHLVITANRSGSIVAFRDGAQVASYSMAGLVGSIANGNFFLGQYGSATGYNFLGKQSDFQVFPRAITATEVGQLYTLGCDALPNESRSLWLKLDDQHSTLALDSSGNDRHGTLTNVNATVGNFFYEGADVPHSYQNDKGYSLVSGTYYPRNESDKVKDTQGNALQYSGKCPRNAQLVQSNCLTMDGTGYLAVTGITGSETVVSKGGTSTVSFASGRINFTSGTCWDLLLSNGNHYPMAEGAGDQCYDIVNAAHGTLTSANLVACWATEQNVYHHNVVKGHSRRENILQGSSDLLGAYWYTWGSTTPTADVDGWWKLATTTEASNGGWYNYTHAPIDTRCTYSVKLKAGTYDSIQILTYSGAVSSPWPTGYNAQIISGPGTISVAGTGLVAVTDLSQTVETHIVWEFEYSTSLLYSIHYLGGLGTPPNLGKYLYIKEPQMWVGTVDKMPPYIGTDNSGRVVIGLVPAKADGTSDAVDLPITNPAGTWHNFAESKIDHTGGVAYPGSAGLPTAWHPNDGATNPQFFRLTTKSGLNVRADRCVYYNVVLAGSRLDAANKFTQTKVLS